MRKVLAVLILAALLLAALSGSVAAQDNSPLVIGLMVDQSGPLADYGHQEENGFKLGLLYAAGVDPADYNNNVDDALAAVKVAGHPVQVVMRDNASNPDTALSQARELVEQQNAEILVGSPSSGTMPGVQQLASDSDVLVFADPAASPAITGANFNVNTFRVCRNSFQDFLAFAPYAEKAGINKVVILAIDNDFGKSSAAAAVATMGSAITFTGDPIYAPLDTTDFTPYLQQVLASGADAVLPIWAGTGIVTLSQQMVELGVQDKMKIITAYSSNAAVAQSDPSAIGSIGWIVYHYDFPNNPVNDWLVAKHKAVYNDVPDLFTECSFATAQAIVAGLQATGGDSTPEALIPKLEGMIFQGPKGTYGIRPSDHQALVPMYIAELTNLTDPEQKYFKLLAEVPAEQIVPPVLLPDNLKDRTSMDADFMTALADMATPEATPEG